jgi:hypothetical protein
MLHEEAWAQVVALSDDLLDDARHLALKGATDNRASCMGLGYFDSLLRGFPHARGGFRRSLGV